MGCSSSKSNYRVVAPSAEGTEGCSSSAVPSERGDEVNEVTVLSPTGDAFDSPLRKFVDEVVDEAFLKAFAQYEATVKLEAKEGVRVAC